MSTGKPPVGGEHKPEMHLAHCLPLSGEGPKITYVLSDDSSLFLLSDEEDVGIRQAPKFIQFGYGDGIMPMLVP